MATLVLQAAGQAVGGLLGPVGAVVGRAAGALAGSVIDQRLFGQSDNRSVGQIENLSVQTSAEGNPIPKVFGRMRIAGTVIWARDFTEHRRTESTGKGGGPSVTQYTYTASFAVALCEGPIARVARVWADGEPLDLTKVVMHVHTGEADQGADHLIEVSEGDAPAYRGLAYVVFEHLPVTPFGNRLPQLTFEVVRPVGTLEPMVRAVTVIPGATEFGYASEEVKRVLGPGERGTENRHLGIAGSDFAASLDELTAVCPNVEQIALVVSWFGDDLRAGACTVRPCVEDRDRETDVAWRVSDETRSSAKLVSSDEAARATYGGTPSDASVISAIREIKARGLRVVFYPFLLMDVPPGNGLTDPYGDGEQATHPWRGRITVEPAPGRVGSPDGTAAADAAISQFVGTAAPSDFSVDGDTIGYAGPAEWSHRRMILHYAHLAAAAGGVDAFLIGSELRGLTTVRGASGYPFVEALSQLADDVRTVVGGSTKISYAADWSEYFGHQPGNGDVRFHLDPLWANANVDFVGIDNYWPLSDWRDGSHLDEALTHSPHDRAYLTANIQGGEGYDWYYASEADRLAQVRSPIEDGAYGKDWVFAYKDLARWWSEPHYDRVAGVEVAQPTAWVPKSKPVWFTEVGCPAVDRGANQPNVFYDPKSSESKLPYFSSGRRDDEMQRAYLEAMLGAFDPAHSADIERFNPASDQYQGRMVDPATSQVWTWDARPWPAFPNRLDVWSDGDNWARGHWLTGRVGGAPFADLVKALFASWGIEPAEAIDAGPVLDGFIVAAPQSLRRALEPLTNATSMMGADTGTGLRFVSLTRAPALTIEKEDVAEATRDGALFAEAREENAALPVEQRLRYFDSGKSFQVASARYRPPEGSTLQTEEIAVSASMNDGLATELAQLALAARWSGRTSVRFALPPSDLSVLPGDVLRLRDGGRDREVIVEEVEDLLHREIVARTLDRAALTPTPSIGSPAPPIAVVTLSPPVAFGLNLPFLDDGVPVGRPYMAVYTRPWPGDMGVWRANGNGVFTLITTLTQPSMAGQVAAVPGPGPTSRWDEAGTMDVVLFEGTLSSRDRLEVLDGANALAVQNVQGAFEVMQFRTAEPIGERTYRLTGLLRGQLGTEDAMAAGIVPGANFAVLNGELPDIRVNLSNLGNSHLYRVGPLAEGIGGLNTATFEFAADGRARLPLSPVHGRALLRRSDDAVLISWIRRTRIDGDDWPNSGDVPLGETEERYALDILDGGSVVRSAQTTEPSFIYSLAAQTADFGGGVDTVSVRLAQIAPGVGPGVPYEVTLNVQQP